ncbi:hypothetical protein RJ40_10270 [Methanofollis aquaemaris]|uniref:Glycosyltransferase RgtA/B/C/D-like domain-containing protein n=1 Tax=Methanofollis aquaemaris TaxID=126734 RepID=A0A8A3S6T7_9EURY|nr:hypothetical protein [Methanofollis aquaemaris]QSZ67855.1 hypothetical protein RJ40_10270 [Methanofollis aquaemaris]
MDTDKRRLSVLQLPHETIKYIFDKLDIIGGLFGAVLGIIVIILSFIGVLGQYYIGFTIIVGSVSYLLLRQYNFHSNQIKAENGNQITDPEILCPRKPPRSFLYPKNTDNISIPNAHKWRILDVIFCFVLIFAQILWYTSDCTRPDLYFILIAIASAILGVEIAIPQSKGSALSMLLKILYISFIIRSGIFFNYPSVMGSDAFTHASIAEVLSNSHFIPPFEISGKYFYYPILHIFIATAKIIPGVDIKTGILIAIGLGSIIIPTLFIYLLGKTLCDSQIGLLGALLFNLTNVVIVRGITNITAGSVTLCCFSIILYFVYRDKKSYVILALLITSIVLITITHQLTTFVVLLALCCITLTSKGINNLNKEKNKAPPSLIVLTLFGVLILFYWSITELSSANSFFEAMVRAVRSMALEGGAYGADKLIVGQQYHYTAIETLIVQSHYLIIPLLVIPGILLWISSKDSRKKTIGISTGLLFIVAYGIPLLGIRTLLTGRWLPLLVALSILPVSDFVIRSVQPIKSNKLKKITLFVLIFFFSLIMITTPAINRDNPIVAKETTVRDQFTHSEIQAVKTTSMISTGDVKIDSAYYGTYRLYGGEQTIIGKGNLWSRIRSLDVLGKNKEVTYDTLYILRECTLHEPIPVRQSDLYGDSKNIPLSEDIFNHFKLGDYNLIYHSKGIYGYNIRGP